MRACGRAVPRNQGEAWKASVPTAGLFLPTHFVNQPLETVRNRRFGAQVLTQPIGNRLTDRGIGRPIDRFATHGSTTQHMSVGLLCLTVNT